MNPRKKESKKWSPVPPELSKQIKAVFEENFKTQLDGKALTVEGRIYPTEIIMRIGINRKGELRFNNFEVSVDHSIKEQNTISQIHVAVDDEYLLKETEEDLEAYGLLDDEEIDTSKPKIFRVPTNNENDTLKKKKKKEDMH